MLYLRLHHCFDGVFFMVTFANFIVLSGLLAGIASPSAVVLDSIDGMPTESANKSPHLYSVIVCLEEKDSYISERCGDKWVEHSVSASQSHSVAVLERNKFVVLEYGEVAVTAFSSTPDQTDDTPFIMASGKYVYDGAIAANFLPFGAQVRFPDLYGDKVFTVEDRMNKRHSERMDIWMETRSEAKKFGIKKLKYEIVKEAKENKNIVAVK